jgi:sugar lactone lactonase YvrE
VSADQATRATTVLLSGLGFPEGLRWHGGRLWFSDMERDVVRTVDVDGATRVVAEVERPSGLGFLPDGTPLVVAADRKLVLRIDGGVTSVHADLRAAEAEWLNDMVVDEAGRAYVDAIRYRDDPGGDDPLDAILLVEPDGSWRVAADRALRPNGIVVTSDGRSLIYASTRRRKLVECRIGERGLLRDQSVWAETGRWTPDGIALDEAGALWIAGLSKSHFVRMERGGGVTDAVAVGKRWAIACALGGEDGTTLFMATQDRETGEGRIETAAVG